MADARVADARVDVGRVVVAALFALSMLSAVGRAWVTITSSGSALRTAPEFACSVVTAAFCALVVAAMRLRSVPDAAPRRRYGWWRRWPPACPS